MPKQNKRKKKAHQNKQKETRLCSVLVPCPGVWFINPVVTLLSFPFSVGISLDGFLVKLGPGVHFPFSDLGFHLV